MNETQKKLNRIYIDYVNALMACDKMSEYMQDEKKSSPLFLDIEAHYGEYLDSDLKVLFVGKENNGWASIKNLKNRGLLDYNFSYDSYVNALTDSYKEFNLGKKKYSNKPIFTNMYKTIQGHRNAGVKLGFLWTNLLRMDCTKNNAFIQNDMFNLDRNSILRSEIDVLKPDIVIFFTGPNYDKYLKRTFDDLSLVSPNSKTLTKRQFAFLQSKNLPQASIRTYHPGSYQSPYIPDKEILKTINDLISSRLSGN